MDEAERSVAYFANKAEAIATSFVMAINGAFFTIRSAGATPTPTQIEQAKLNVAKARYVYVDSVNELMTEFTDMAIQKNDKPNAVKIEMVTRHLISISTELTLQANRAITSGHQNRAASLLGKSAHGATGLLIQRQLSKVELTAHDMNGRKWSEPSTIVKFVTAELARDLFDGADDV